MSGLWKDGLAAAKSWKTIAGHVCVWEEGPVTANKWKTIAGHRAGCRLLPFYFHLTSVLVRELTASVAPERFPCSRLGAAEFIPRTPFGGLVALPVAPSGRPVWHLAQCVLWFQRQRPFFELMRSSFHL